MTLNILRSYSKARNNVISSGNNYNSFSALYNYFSRAFSDDKNPSPEFINSTIFIENGYNVHELPVVVRRLKDLEDLNIPLSAEISQASDPLSYRLIQEEFKQCTDLREVFSLITKCTKITPNIALGAIERIYDLEKDGNLNMTTDQSVHINFAKGAILEKLLNIVLKTEDTQTILNVLKTTSSIMEPHKYKFCDELFLRVLDNKLSLEQLCDFTLFLIRNKDHEKYSETIDKLWVGFVGKEKEINQNNIVQIFKILPGLKVSKKPIISLLEQKLLELWCHINVSAMQDIFQVFLVEKLFSVKLYTVLGHWFRANIHNLDDDELLDIVTKFTELKYNDHQIEAAVEKFLKLKCPKIKSQVLIIGILNYCTQFKLCNKNILNTCAEYFINNRENISPSFLKSFIYPYGYLYVVPVIPDFWMLAEEILVEKFYKINVDDLSSIVLSYIYCGYYPLKLVSKIFSAEYMAKINNNDVLKKMHLIDTALSLECKEYSGPLLAKDQWFKPVLQDYRTKNIVDKIVDSIISVIDVSEKLSTAVVLPNFCSDDTYLIDIMVQPAGPGNNTFNWKSQSIREGSTAILIHLPDHYCSDNEQLIGPQVMKKRHLKILGMRVVSLKYSLLSQFYTSRDSVGLQKYLQNNICI